MEELQRRLRPDSERTLKQANARLEHLKELEIGCIDSINQIVFHTSFIPSSPSPELVCLGQRKNHLKKEMKFLNALVLILDSSSESEPDASTVDDAMYDLTPRNEWNRDFVISFLSYLFTNGRKINGVWIKGAPESFRYDRDMYLCYLNTKSYSSYGYDDDFFNIPDHLWEDKDIVLMVMKNSPFRIDSANFHTYYSRLENIPAKLWEDKDLVVATVKHFPEVLRQDDRGQSRVPHHFLDDQDVFLAFANSLQLWRHVDIQRLTSQFSVNIRSDAELMRLVVKKSYLCASYIDPSLKENREFRDFVVEQTFAEGLEECREGLNRRDSTHGTSTRLNQGGPSRLLELLASHRNGVPILVDFLDSPRRGCLAVYEAAPDHLQHHPDILYAMLRNGHLTVDQIPENVLPRGRDFWLNAVNRGGNSSRRVDSSLWRQIPDQYKDDPDFLQAFLFIDQHAIETALADASVPRLVENRLFWLTVLESQIEFGDYMDVDVFAARIPLEMCGDRELMLQACEGTTMYYECWDASLQEEEAIITAAVDTWCSPSHDDFIFPIPHRVQSMHPHLVVKARRKAQVEQIISSYVRLDEVAEDLHSNLEVMKAYFDFNKDRNWAPELPDAMISNQDFALFVAQQDFGRETMHFEAYVCEELRSDKEFMERAVAQNPQVLAAGAGELARDFDLAVIAVGHNCHNRDMIDYSKLDDDYESELDFLYSVATKAREQVIFFNGFTKGFLMGLTDNPGPNCKLPMLVQDNATSTAWKKVIAEFAGIPNGNRIHQLRAASMRSLIPRQDERTLLYDLF